MRRKYVSSSGWRPPACILAAVPETLRDGLDRLTEQVAVVEPRPAAERAHLGAQLRLDERVDDDRGPASRAPHDLREVVDALDHRMPDLLELLLRELRLERVHEAGRRLARRIGDHVQLDRLRSHGLSV